MKIFVIAGTLVQFEHFRHKKLSLSLWHQSLFPRTQDWVFVNRVEAIRGCTIEHGAFIGSWRQIHNLEGIFRELMICTKMNSQASDNLCQLYRNWHDELAQDILRVNVNVPQPQPMVLPQPVVLTQPISWTPDPDMDFL